MCIHYTIMMFHVFSVWKAEAETEYDTYQENLSVEYNGIEGSLNYRECRTDPGTARVEKMTLAQGLESSLIVSEELEGILLWKELNSTETWSRRDMEKGKAFYSMTNCEDCLITTQS